MVCQCILFLRTHCIIICKFFSPRLMFTLHLLHPKSNLCFSDDKSCARPDGAKVCAFLFLNFHPIKDIFIIMTFILKQAQSQAIILRQIFKIYRDFINYAKVFSTKNYKFHQSQNW